jgi:hypothetical protein
VIGRGADAVGCAHCTAMGGKVECRICGRVVCAACAADWTTCDQPSGRVIRLGLTARLRDVDPAGRLGLVGRFPLKLALVDLRRLSWVQTPELPRLRSQGPLGPRLAAGHVLYPSYVHYDSDGTGSVFRGITVLSLVTGASDLVTAPRPAHGAAVSRGGRYYSYASEQETVEIFELGELPASTSTVGIGAAGGGIVARASFAPYPGKVVQAVFVDDARELVAAGTWGQVSLHARRGDEYVPTARADIDGDVRWIAIGGDVLVAAAGRELVAWQIEGDRSLGPVLFRSAKPGAICAVSRDGPYLAHDRDDCAIAVHDLDTGSSQTFTEHTDAVSFIRFAGDDQLLVTGDDDNRVVLRPRTATGYAPVVIPVDLAD